jgi:Mrp family chromosome partitioning ATPase
MGCNQNCGSCSSSCTGKGENGLIVKPHEGTFVKKIIGIVSGKGGVGKSLVTSLLASVSARKGYKTAVLDADLTGPSIPAAFGIKTKASGSEAGINPVETATGIKVMSMNLLLPDETSPVIWRGPIIAGTVKQFWSEVLWGDVDFMFVDMPPGTGDVPLTVFQSLPIDGIVLVSTPQDVVGMIVKKAANMATAMNVPLLAIVENMSYMTCPHCGEKLNVFGDGKIDEIAAEYGVNTVIKLPLDPGIRSAVDNGAVELVVSEEAEKLFDILSK